MERIAPCCWRGPFDKHWKPDGACSKKTGARFIGFVLAGVGGVMVVISLDELIPVAKSFDAEHTPIVGVIIGMIVMVLSLWMLGQT